jgi:hypothetical protein
MSPGIDDPRIRGLKGASSKLHKTALQAALWDMSLPWDESLGWHEPALQPAPHRL